MTHFLRHTAVCLWIALLLTGGAGLWLLPSVQGLVGLEVIPFVAAGGLALVFMGVGWSVTRLGLRQVKRRLQSAARADREGQPAEAEAQLRDALAVLDRFWVTTAARRRAALITAARLARLYLAHGRLAPAGAAFVSAYLAQFPADEEVAESWAAQAELHGGLTEDQQELAGRLARRYPENQVITRAAARLYLQLERSDYDALQCYRRVCDAQGLPPEEFRAALARVLGRPGVPAAMAPAAAEAVAAAPSAPPPARVLQPGEGDEGGGPAPIWGEADDVEPRFRMTSQAQAEEEEEPPAPVRRPPAGVLAAGAKVLGWLRAAGGALAGLHRALSARAPGMLLSARTLWRTLAARHVLGAAVVAGLGMLLVWLVATAMDDYFSRAPEPPATTAAAPDSEPSPAVTDDPYTLQVAAYLKQDGALKLVEDLKRKGLDAYWTETLSGGKVYYQVRISHFPDQQSARDYGRSLKGKGMIEDFYVTNYVR